MKNTSYRPELDGLRCLAVMAVIVYHAKLSVYDFGILRGGFLGVDVFFVLSGYFITKIIQSGLEKEKFNLFEFYINRIKRIIPALYVMLALSMIASYYILLPEAIIKYSQSLINALFFNSNHYFLSEDSYTSQSSIFKPLLHTWSLAIEWQFYLIFPFAFMALFKIFKSSILTPFLIIAIISFTYSVYAASNFPDLAFYTLTTRTWELLIGSISAVFLSKRNSPKNDYINSMISFAGLMMIISSIVMLNDGIKHPSFLTLIPTIGTILIITHSTKNTLTNKILSTRAFVFVGVISYSLYLWHQPIFSFFRIYHGEKITTGVFFCLLLATLLVSCISYYVIEKPFRKKRSNKAIIILFATTVFPIIFFTVVTDQTNGIPSRLDDRLTHYYNIFNKPEFKRLNDTNNPGLNVRTGVNTTECGLRSLNNPCVFRDNSWIVVGDSYATQYAPTLLDIAASKKNGLMILTYEQCPFVSDIWFGNVPECSVIDEQRWKQISKLKQSHKFFIAVNYDQFAVPKKAEPNAIELSKQNYSGGHYIETTLAWRSFANNIQRLLSLGHEVYVVYPSPNPSEDVANLFFSKLRMTNNSFETVYTENKDAYKQAITQSNLLDSYLKNQPHLHKIRPIDTLCDNERCKIIDKNGGLYNSGFHLSQIGVKEVLSDSGIK